jgi:hypothetical protein
LRAIVDIEWGESLMFANLSPRYVAGLAATVILLSGIPAGAHPGGGMGGMGMGGMGGMGMGGGFGGRGEMGAGMGMGGEGRGSGGFQGRGSMEPGVTSHSSISALDNQKLTTSLTAALGHSHITLPTGGLHAACSGFHNLGQCVSALHVAKNLSLPGGFTALKALMTGQNPLSLGAAIQQLSPHSDAKAQAHAAKRQTNVDMRSAAEVTS